MKRMRDTGQILAEKVTGLPWAAIGVITSILIALAAPGFASYMGVRDAAKQAVVDAAAAAEAAKAAPDRVIKTLSPRLEALEVARDTASAERVEVRRDVGALRVYFCRECVSRYGNRGNHCDGICGTP